MNRKPSFEKHTPFGILNSIDGANSFTSSATRALARSVTDQTLLLRVPTKVTMPCGPTAIWRASGTSAYSAMWKPLGNLMAVRFFLIASALGPVCGMCAGSTVPVCRKLPSFSRLPAVGVGCARAGELNASASAETAPKLTDFMASSSRPCCADAGRNIAQASGCVRQQCVRFSAQAREVVGEIHDVLVGHRAD